MKSILMFTMDACPYCQEALRWMDQVKKEHPAYAAVPIEYVEETREAARAAQYDYYYVPTYYVDGAKVHEGAASKEIIERVFALALGK